jgi:hypothetical protein
LVSAGVGVGAALDEGVGLEPGELAVEPGEVDADALGDGPDAVPVALVVYELPLDEYVMNTLIAGCEVPVRLGPEKQTISSF